MRTETAAATVRDKGRAEKRAAVDDIRDQDMWEERESSLKEEDKSRESAL